VNQVKKRTLLITAAILATAIGTVMFVIGYSHINARYPSTQLKAVSLNQMLHVNKVEVSASQYEIVPLEELLNRYPDIKTNTDFEDAVNTLDEVRFLLVILHVKNSGKTGYHFDLEAVAATETWFNGIDRGLFMEINKREMRLALSSGEETIVHVPYGLYSSHFLEGWEDIEQMPFRVVFDLYPEKKVIFLRS
jgi:hypothetical protein